jgi:hypothetical protein
MKKRIALFMAVCFLFAGDVRADDVFKWVDDKGSVHFTDNPDKIPKKYRKKTQHRKMESSSGQDVGDTTTPDRRRRAPRRPTRVPTRSDGLRIKKMRAKKSKEFYEKARKDREKKKAEAAEKAYMRCMSRAHTRSAVARCVRKRITEPCPLEIQP